MLFFMSTRELVTWTKQFSLPVVSGTVKEGEDRSMKYKMNRRSLFRGLAGIIGSLYLPSIPKAKKLTVADITKARKMLEASERKRFSRYPYCSNCLNKCPASEVTSYPKYRVGAELRTPCGFTLTYCKQMDDYGVLNEMQKDGSN